VDLKIDWDISPGGGYSEMTVDLIKFMQGDKDTVEKAIARFKTLNGEDDAAEI